MKNDLLLLLLALVGACADKESGTAGEGDRAGGSTSKLAASAVVSSSSEAPPQIASDARPQPSSALSNLFGDRSGEYEGLDSGDTDSGDTGPRRPLVARIRTGATAVNGRLPPEVIQRIVRRNLGRIRLCYEHALTLDVAAAGKLTFSYVIEVSGTVRELTTETDLKDATLVECARKVFETLEYPKPEGGVVKVRFPLLFSAPDFAFTINRKPSDKVQADDVRRAIEAAGYTVLLVSPKPGFPEATLFVLGRDLELTFDPYDSLEGGSSGQQVGARKATREFERLAKNAVLLIEGRLVLAAECPDRSRARALLDAIALPIKRK